MQSTCLLLSRINTINMSYFVFPLSHEAYACNQHFWCCLALRLRLVDINAVNMSYVVLHLRHAGVNTINISYVLFYFSVLWINAVNISEIVLHLRRVDNIFMLSCIWGSYALIQSKLFTFTSPLLFSYLALLGFLSCFFVRLFAVIKPQQNGFVRSFCTPFS